MATCQLRVFPRPEEEAAPSREQAATVAVRLGDLYPVLKQALRANYVWLKDFEDDEIRVTADFYDVLRAFSRLKPAER